MKRESAAHQDRRFDHSHAPDAIAARLAAGPGHSYIKDLVYGAIDGAVTTFAVVSGVAGAGLSSTVIIVLGLANLFADGFSMAVSNFLGTRAERQLRARVRAAERRHIEQFPHGEREEIRQIFARKGFAGDDLERAVDVITGDIDRWIDAMLQEEHGIPLASPNPWRAAAATFAAFVVVGFVPLAIFLWNALATWPAATPFAVSAVSTGVAFFVVGAAKARYVATSWWRSGLETLAMGGAAAALAYWVGWALRGLVA